MKYSKFHISVLACVTLAFICTVSLGVIAQDVTHPAKTEETGPPVHKIHQTHIQNAEVIHVSGRDVVVRLENGRYELLDLPKDFKFSVDGRELLAHELTPGTKINQEVHTVTTPREVTTLRTVDGKVWHVSPPYVILAFPNGDHKRYKVPEDIVFHIEGEHNTVFDLRKGMEISATVITTAPEQLISQHTVVTGQAPVTANVPFEGPLLIGPVPPAPAEVAKIEAPFAPQELPKTASLEPLVGLLGLLFLGLYAGLKVARRNSA